MVANSNLTFSTANQNAELCAAVETSDDGVVEAPSSFSLQLGAGLQDGRVRVQPDVMIVTVEDNDSRFDALSGCSLHHHHLEPAQRPSLSS